MLAVSGRLDPAMYGPGTLDQNMTRRSIYFFIKRSQLIPMMMLFDWPEHLVSIGQRPVTTIAPQALMFMNSPQGRDYATAFADRLKASVRLLCRPPGGWRLDGSRVKWNSQLRKSFSRSRLRCTGGWPRGCRSTGADRFMSDADEHERVRLCGVMALGLPAL